MIKYFMINVLFVQISKGKHILQIVPKVIKPKKIAIRGSYCIFSRGFSKVRTNFFDHAFFFFLFMGCGET